MTSELEETFALLCLAHNYPDPDREAHLLGDRRRFDFAWPDKLIAVEIEGGIWTNGRHTRGAGFTADCRKYNEAQIAGWRVLRFTGEMLNDGTAMDTLRKAWDT